MGEVFSCCRCKQPKHFNDSPDLCELDKFDQMMSFLQSEVPNFCQLVAVDRDFAVFSRIWCVAELVQAHSARMPQHVQLYRCEELRDEAEDLSMYTRLATLTVARAEARARGQGRHFGQDPLPSRV